MGQITVCNNFLMQNTEYATTKVMPMKLVFDRNAIMNLTLYANCNLIKNANRKELTIIINCKIEK